MRAQRNFRLRCLEPRDLIPVLIHLHHKSGKFLSHLGRFDRDDARGAKRLAEIQPEHSMDAGGKGYARNRGKRHIPRRRQLAIRDLWEDRRRGGPVRRDPILHIHQKGVHEPLVIVRILQILRSVASRRDCARSMIAAGKDIETRSLGKRHIPAAIDAGMRERRRAAVVLIRCVGIENLRNSAAAESSLEKPVGDSGLRIDLIDFRERKNIRRIDEVEKRTGIARGLRELVVKAAASPARDMGPYPVEDLLAAFIPVEPEVEKGPQKPAALRTAKS